MGREDGGEVWGGTAEVRVGRREVGAGAGEGGGIEVLKPSGGRRGGRNAGDDGRGIEGGGGFGERDCRTREDGRGANSSERRLRFFWDGSDPRCRSPEGLSRERTRSRRSSHRLAAGVLQRVRARIDRARQGRGTAVRRLSAGRRFECVGLTGRARVGDLFGGRARGVDRARRSLKELGEEWEEGCERSERHRDSGELVREVLWIDVEYQQRPHERTRSFALAC